MSNHSSPINMILPCPNCRKLHIDGPEGHCLCGHYEFQHEPPNEKAIDRCSDDGCGCTEYQQAWDNPPHKSHLCHSCGTIWRPADIPTNGVAKIETRGKKDTWPIKGDQ